MIMVMPRLSLSMIVKDEAETLSRILSDVSSFCDELIIADTGSSDGTPEIAAAAGAKVVNVPWVDNFSAARNASLEACTGDWVIWLDADDRIPPSSQKEFTRIIADLEDDVDVLVAPYYVEFDDFGHCIRSLNRERVLRRAANLRWVGSIHESVNTSIARLRVEPTLVVEHRPTAAQESRKDGRNMRIIEKVYAAGDRSIRLLYHRAMELLCDGKYEDAVAAFCEAMEVLDTERSGCNCPEGVAACSAGYMSYESLLALAKALIALDRRGEAMHNALKAVELSPIRPEAWMLVGGIYYSRENWDLAAPFFSAATQSRRSTSMDGGVNVGDYSWVPWDCLSICLGNAGRYEEAFQAGQKALPGNPEAERVRRNLEWFTSRIEQY